jgi:hypothetical protein
MRPRFGVRLPILVVEKIDVASKQKVLRMNQINQLRKRFLDSAARMCGEEYTNGYLEALAHVEAALSHPDVRDLVGESGYSYSGIASIIRHDKPAAWQFIEQLHIQHAQAKERVETLEGELAAAKRLVGLQLQAYRDTHTVLNLRDGEPIIYPFGSALIFVRVTEKSVSIERYRANII